MADLHQAANAGDGGEVLLGIGAPGCGKQRLKHLLSAIQIGKTDIARRQIQRGVFADDAGIEADRLVVLVGLTQLNELFQKRRCPLEIPGLELALGHGPEQRNAAREPAVA